jgi:adenosylcobinamide kinase/adenosylcobinamide-phosphate guanylyltransferase
MSAQEILKVLITGGCRSGKSEYALGLAEGSANKVFLATAEGKDQEMCERIERHRLRRGRGWRTVEEPLNLVSALAGYKSEADLIVIDCVTLWLSNLLLRGDSPESILNQINALAREVQSAGTNLIMVTNEVGSGIVPVNDLARRFRDLVGFGNQRLAKVCHRVVLMVAGLPLVIKEENHGTVKAMA